MSTQSKVLLAVFVAIGLIAAYPIIAILAVTGILVACLVYVGILHAHKKSREKAEQELRERHERRDRAEMESVPPFAR